MRLDMHVHTNASFDCLTEPEHVMAAAVARGIDRICITDHNEVHAALALRERYGPRVIVGEEVKTAEGVDIIGLFLRDKIDKGTPARETCALIHAQGGLVYVPHPFARGKGGGGRILPSYDDLIDAMEGFNGRIHERRLNERAQRWARNAELPLGAGSDAHTAREVGRTYVEVRPFDDEPASLLEALRHSTIRGKTSSRFVHLASTWAKLRKRRNHPPAD